MGNKSYGLAWDMDTQLAWAKLRTTVGWDHISDYTRHDHDIWYTELSCTYGDISGRCTRGGLGHISQAVDNYTFKTRLDWQKFTVGNVSHQPYFGAEYIYSDAWTERHNQSESYVINAAGKKTNHTIYHKGKGSLGIDNYTLYMADRISWRNVSLMPGVRYDYDNYLSNHNISPRFMTEWDIFADQTSMITAGYNRYYGGNILDMGLRDIRNSWTESVSGNKTLTRYQDLKTPYNHNAPAHARLAYHPATHQSTYALLLRTGYKKDKKKSICRLQISLHPSSVHNNTDHQHKQQFQFHRADRSHSLHRGSKNPWFRLMKKT